MEIRVALRNNLIVLDLAVSVQPKIQWECQSILELSCCNYDIIS